MLGSVSQGGKGTRQNCFPAWTPPTPPTPPLRCCFKYCRWQEKLINKNSQTGISRCVSSCSKGVSCVNMMHGNTINEPNSSNSSFVGKLFIDVKKKKRQHLIKVLPVWEEMIYVGSFWWCCCDLRSRRSIYHGNILIKEQCRLPVLACWTNICAQMYSAAWMYMLSSQFFHFI